MIFSFCFLLTWITYEKIYRLYSLITTMRYYPLLLLCLWITQNRYQSKKQHPIPVLIQKIPPIRFSMCVHSGYSKGKEALLYASSLLLVKSYCWIFCRNARNCLTHATIYVIINTSVAFLLCSAQVSAYSLRPVQPEVRQHRLYGCMGLFVFH